MSAHTPGPWSIKTERANAGRGAPRDSEIRSRNTVVVRLGVLRHPEQEADARLIAAAPDLLAALRAIRGHACWQSNPRATEITNICNAAIAKAEGR